MRGNFQALARDGRSLVYAPSETRLALLRLPAFSLVWEIETPLPGRGPVSLAFDPTAQRVACARAGQLVLLDADTGALLPGAVLPDAIRVGHPDWSPDGRSLSVTLWPEKGPADEQALEGSSLARIAVALDGALSAPEVLLASSKPDETFAFASHSPDGAWLVFERLRGKLGDAREAGLWMVASAGGTPLPLTLGAPSEPKPKPTGSQQPRWLQAAGSPWLVFVSSRALDGRMLAKDQRQLWLAPMFLEQARKGQDPSGPALWLPFQAADASSSFAVFGPRAE
jgi:hypothetical protein